MKRYLVFLGQIYYPQGGMYDLEGSFDKLEEAIDFVAKEIGPDRLSHMWFQIVDSKTWEILTDIEYT